MNNPSNSAQAPGGAPVNSNSAPAATDSSNLQQAFLQSMQAQQQQQHPSAMFGAPQPSPAGAAPGPAPLAQPFGQLFKMSPAQAQAPGQNLAAPAPQALQAQLVGAPAPQAQATAQGQAQQQGNNCMITQLVASLQAQQQAQQQAQVQAALARALGPGGNMAMGNVMGLGLGAQAGGVAAGAPGVIGVQGLTQNANAMAAAAQAGQDARDFLSRMQLEHQQQQQQQQQQQVQQQQQQQAVNNYAPNSNNAIALGGAKVNGLAQLQIEQERHNKMLQMVQTDRQERSILAAQEALAKKQRMELKKSGSSALSDNGGPVVVVAEESIPTGSFTRQVSDGGADGEPNESLVQQAPANDAVKTNNPNDSLVQQFPVNDAIKTIFSHQIPNANAASLSAAAAGMMFPVAPSSFLTNTGLNTALNTAQLAAATKPPPPLNTVGQGFQGGLGAMGLGMLGNAPVGGTLGHKLGAAAACGAAIVPCRARGMPVDHNFKTAYFVIPDGIEHGDELMCSYPACRQAGVKFRYCVHCKVPVAKRNFRNRHRHGVSGGEESSSEEEEVCQPVAGGGVIVNGEVCQPVAKEGDANDYAGVKREHLIIIPGAGAAAAAANNAPQTTKKKKRKSGHVRVPCRARGMPMAHNFKTAYFNIPPNIEHGDELLCSFPSCRIAGAKFRYCLHCKVPVAKRNFRNRHKHGNLGEKLTKKKGWESPDSVKAENQEVKPSAEPELSPKAEGEKTSEIKSEDAANQGEPRPAKQEEAAAAATLPKADFAESSGPGASNKVSVSSTHDAAKVRRWVELLEDKPAAGDKQAMAVWMLNLMNATDSKGGGAVPAASAVDEASPIQEVARVTQVEGVKQMPPMEEEDATSSTSGSSQPPKKKFKQDFESV